MSYKNKLYLAIGVLILLLSYLIYLSTTISDDIKNDVKAINTRFSNVEKSILEKQNIYDKELSSKYSVVKQLATKAKFESSFKEASSKAELLHKDLEVINNIIDNNDNDDEKKLLKLMLEFSPRINTISTLSLIPMSKMKQLYSITKNLNTHVKKHNTLYIDSTTKIKKLIQYIKKASIKHLNKKNDLEKKLQTSLNYQNTITVTNDKLLKDIDEQDFLNIMIGFNKIKQYEFEISDYYNKIIMKVHQLNSSYTKILEDMQAKYYVEIARSSWDNYSDYSTEKTYIYSRKIIDKNMFISFSNSSGTMYSGNCYGSIRKNNFKIDKSYNLPYGHNSCELWVNSLVVNYFHKYTIIEDKIASKTQWQKVDEAYYLKNLPNLGMEIVSKPYGYYEDEAIKTAAPAGMSQVGNGKYGEWRTQPSGSSFWFFYMGSPFYGSSYHRYDRSNYNDYQRNRNRSYYGRNNSYGTYGRNTYSNSKYRNSNFASKNKSFVSRVKSGATNLKNRVSNGLRGVGSRSRGRGASGGGK